MELLLPGPWLHPGPATIALDTWGVSHQMITLSHTFSISLSPCFSLCLHHSASLYILNKSLKHRVYQKWNVFVQKNTLHAKFFIIPYSPFCVNISAEKSSQKSIPITHFKFGPPFYLFHLTPQYNFLTGCNSPIITVLTASNIFFLILSLLLKRFLLRDSHVSLYERNLTIP